MPVIFDTTRIISENSMSFDRTLWQLEIYLAESLVKIGRGANFEIQTSLKQINATRWRLSCYLDCTPCCNLLNER